MTAAVERIRPRVGVNVDTLRGCCKQDEIDAGKRPGTIPHRQTLFVQHGKGDKDRHVPIGRRALAWVRAYGDEVRPRLTSELDSGALFLSARGRPLCRDWLSRTVAGYVKASASGKRGSCHLFRHTAATPMLDGGADIRYVADLLGHSRLETTQIYTRVSIAKLRAVHAACHPAGDGQTASPPGPHVHQQDDAICTACGQRLRAPRRQRSRPQ
jgi:integrase